MKRINRRINRNSFLRRHHLVSRTDTVGTILLQTVGGIFFALVFSAVALAFASVFASFACHFAPSCIL